MRPRTSERLNQEWELDSTPADVICDDGLRYAVVVAIDIWSRRTRALVAPTSRATAIAALFRRCLLDWGVPELVRTDEGADYTSRHVVGVIADLEIDHDICPPFAPDAKPFVERVIKTIGHDLFANLPGFTGHNVADAQALRARKSYAARRRAGRARNQDHAGRARNQDPAGRAQSARCDDDVETFRVALSADRVAGLSRSLVRRPLRPRAARRPRRSLALRARQRLDRAELRRIGDVRALDALLAAPADDGWRTVRKSGIRLGNVDYIAGPLGGIVGERVHVRRDPGDLDRIFVYLPAPSGPERPGFVCVARGPGAHRRRPRRRRRRHDARLQRAQPRRPAPKARDLAKRHKPERAMADVLATTQPRTPGASSRCRATARPTRRRRCARPRAPPTPQPRATRAKRPQTRAILQRARDRSGAGDSAIRARDRSGAGDPDEGAATPLPKRRTALAAAVQLYKEEF